jgi:hypothetical protein
MRRLALLLAAVAAAGCGGSAPKPDHATLTDVRVRPRSVEFTFDDAPQQVRVRWSPRRTVAECGSGLPVRPAGTAVLLVSFQPAQTHEVPRRIVMPSGPLLEVDKVCDFEAEVGWALGVEGTPDYHVSREGAKVTVSFGG